MLATYPRWPLAGGRQAACPMMMQRRGPWAVFLSHTANVFCNAEIPRTAAGR
jgi:hypothetical protein